MPAQANFMLLVLWKSLLVIKIKTSGNQARNRFQTKNKPIICWVITALPTKSATQNSVKTTTFLVSIEISISLKRTLRYKVNFSFWKNNFLGFNFFVSSEYPIFSSGLRRLGGYNWERVARRSPVKTETPLKHLTLGFNF